MSEPRPKLFLLDAMALIYRAFFALNKNPRINSKGLNTSAILGFANTLYEVIKKEKPSHIGVAMDTKAPTHRHTEFAEYKANREKMPDDLAASNALKDQTAQKVGWILYETGVAVNSPADYGYPKAE